MPDKAIRLDKNVGGIYSASRLVAHRISASATPATRMVCVSAVYCIHSSFVLAVGSCAAGNMTNELNSKNITNITFQVILCNFSKRLSFQNSKI